MKKSRQPALDLSRFLAAVIVFTGHLFFLPQTHKWPSDQITLLSPIRTGDTAVLYFYALSGYVLTIDATKQTYFNWTKRRWLRLYPVYISAWLIGFGIVLVHNHKLINVKVILLGLFGFQSWDPNVNLVINAPLWSLSVEIIFAFFLYYILKLRDFPIVLFASIGPAIIFWNSSPNSPVLRSLPYFLIGILLSSEVFRRKRPNRYLTATFFVIALPYFVLIGAKQILALPYSVRGELSKILIIATLLFFVSKIELSGKIEGISTFLGKRAFCIYAFHYPVLLVTNYLVHPVSSNQFLVYIFCSIPISVGIAEIAFRFVDEPSIARSRRK